MSPSHVKQAWRLLPRRTTCTAYPEGHYLVGRGIIKFDGYQLSNALIMPSEGLASLSLSAGVYA